MLTKLVRVVAVSVLLSLQWAGLYSFATEREKAEEGRYAILRKGGLVQGTEHSWILWLLPDGGYEFEDHFQPDKSSSQIMAAFLAPGMPLSKELRKSLENSVEPSDLKAVFSSDHQLLSLTVTGKKLDGSAGEGLRCKSSSSAIECEATQEKTKLRVHEPSGLFWWYSIPMLLRPWLGPSQTGQDSARPRKAVLLHFGYAPKRGDAPRPGMKFEPGRLVPWGDKPQLETIDLTVTNLGPDTLVLGDKSFHAQKYQLQMKGKQGDPLSLTAWTDAQGVVLAVADAGLPDNLVALVQYKKYPGTAPQAPGVAEK